MCLGTFGVVFGVMLLDLVVFKFPIFESVFQDIQKHADWVGGKGVGDRWRESGK